MIQIYSVKCNASAVNPFSDSFNRLSSTGISVVGLGAALEAGSNKKACKRLGYRLFIDDLFI